MQLNNLIANYEENFKLIDANQNTQSSLGEVKIPELEDFLNTDEVESKPLVPISEYQKYLEQKNLLKNYRIEKSLIDRTHNEKVAELMKSGILGDSDIQLEENTKTENLIGESSELTGNSILQIIKTEISQEEMYKNESEIAEYITNYENGLVKKYKAKNITSKTPKSRPKFSQLTENENLNYIKFNLLKPNEGLRIVDEIKDIDSYRIAPALIQKIGYFLRSQDAIKVIRRNEYKALLRGVVDRLSQMDNKNIVDSLFSVARLFGQKRLFYKEYFNYAINQFLIVVCNLYYIYIYI